MFCKKNTYLHTKDIFPSSAIRALTTKESNLKKKPFNNSYLHNVFLSNDVHKKSRVKNIKHVFAYPLRDG